MRLQVKLFLIVAPCAVLSLILIYLFTNAGLHERASREMLKELDLALDIAEHQFKQFVTAAETDATLLAETSALRRYASASKQDKADAILRALVQDEVLPFQQTHPEYLNLSLVDSDGVVDPLITDGGPLPLYRTPLDPDSPSTSIYTDFTAGQSVLVVTYPLSTGPGMGPTDNTEDSSQGSEIPSSSSHLILTAGLEGFASQIEFDAVSEQVFWSAVADDGQIVLHEDQALTGTFDPELLHEASAVTASGEVSTAPYRDEPMIISRQKLLNDISLVALLPDSAVRKSIVDFSRQLLIVSAVSTFMGVATFFSLLRLLVISPLIRLRELAMTIGLKNHIDRSHADVDIQRRDEIGDLSRAFKDTSERLQASMDELQDSHTQIETLAYRDSLTGLANRRLFNQVAEQRIGQAREHRQKLCVLFLDLDDFKRINDTQGHKAGDRLLETVSERLLGCLEDEAPGLDCIHTLRKKSSTVARMGGDEFIALLPHSEHGREGEEAASRILQAMARPISLNGLEFVVSTSIGIALYPNHADNVDDLVKCADAAMYEAKRLNKNNYRTYGSSIQKTLEDRMQLELDLRQAMAKNEFSLVFQPQYSVNDMELVGAEALLRWNHAERGLVPPDIFIPIAEERGLIGEIGAWVLDEACRQWKEWQKSGIAMDQIAVNVSARQFAFGDIQQLVDEVLQRYDMPASALELELTESCIIEAPAEMFNTLSDLRACGIAIAMDDFGTGYSSLSTIATMPVDTLKIDRSFITNLTIGSPNEKIVSAILMLADSLKMQVVAEGVEQESELDFLRSKQCHTAQGYYMARPLSVQDMTALLHERAERRFKRIA